MLESIVKVYVPFGGEYNRVGFSKKGRVVLPSDIVRTLMDRQKVKQRGNVILYYTLHTGQTPRFIELTDFFQEGDDADFSLYRRTYINSQSRLCIPPSDLEKIGMQNGEPVVFVGTGHSISIFPAEAYKSTEDSPTN